MITFEEILKSTEKRKRVDDWIEKYSRCLELDKLHRQKILNDDSYMNWLITFTEEYPSFATDDWLYCPEEISKANRDKVNDLRNLFGVIDDYAAMNYLPYKENNFGWCYYVECNGIIFEVGIIGGQGTEFYVSREKKTNDVIKFCDIQKGVKTERAKKIDGIFQKLGGVLEELSKEKVSDDTILVKTKSIINNRR